MSIMSLIPQIMICMTGMTAVFLVGTKGRWRRWGYVLGLCGQPFWFWETASKEQWILFSMCIVYTISWVNGLRNHWHPEKGQNENS